MLRLSCFLLLAGVSLSCLAESVTKDYHETFSVKPGDVLLLQHGDGDVKIEPAQDDTLTIDIHYYLEETRWMSGEKPGFEATFSQRGKNVKVVGRQLGRSGAGIRYTRKLDYTYTITAPSWLRLELDGDDGNISISQWRADIELREDDGDIELLGVETEQVRLQAEDGHITLQNLKTRLMLKLDDGDVDLSGSRLGEGEFHMADGHLKIFDSKGKFAIRTDDGHIEARGFEGEIRATTGDGDFMLKGSRVTRLDVDTDDGKVDISLTDSPVPEIFITGEDGGVSLQLSDAIDAQLDLRSNDGDISLHGVPMDGLNVKKQQIEGKLGEGRGRISVRTDDGSIILRGRE